MSLFDYKLTEIHNKSQNKELSVTDLVDQAFTRISEREDRVKAFITLDEEGARSSAKALDERLASEGTRGLLFGLPVGIKDNIVTEGLRTTCASQFCPISHRFMMQRLSVSYVRGYGDNRQAEHGRVCNGRLQ